MFKKKENINMDVSTVDLSNSIGDNWLKNLYTFQKIGIQLVISKRTLYVSDMFKYLI